jgi:UDP-glucose:glycoprotein glucosyltransferase
MGLMRWTEWGMAGVARRAKTIDLCNNPQHKESKLDMARRVVSGPLFNESWVELDGEVKAFESKVAPLLLE